jgi:hypothetical protein
MALENADKKKRRSKLAPRQEFAEATDDLP